LPGSPDLPDLERDQPGWEVLKAGLAEARASFGPSVVAAYAIGSLAHGGFAADVSDVDLALVLDALDRRVDKRVEQIKRKVAASLGTSIAGRLSVFWSTWDDLARRTGRGRFPWIDQLDLVESGVTVFGADGRARIVLPTGEDLRRRLLVESAEFMVKTLASPQHDEWLQVPQRLVAQGRREMAKAVLFPVRFLYTLETGKAGANAAAVEHFLAGHGGAVHELVRVAMRWRDSGLETSGLDVTLLAGALPPLYLEVVARYRAELVALGRPDLEKALGKWLARITPAA
jgi:hypothetical protein